MEVVLKRNSPGNTQRFEIEGNPGTKQSVRIMPVYDKQGNPKTSLTHKGKHKVEMRQFQDKETVNNQNYLKWCIKGSLPFGWELWDDPIIVRQLHYVFYPPKDMVERVKHNPVHVFKSTKPDLPDNLNKLVFDAMKGIVFTDDKLIVGIENCYKYYGLQPKTIIVLERMIV